jgi:hypothetical protein
VNEVLQHGASGTDLDRPFWRSALVEVPRVREPENVCGPDVTQWLIDQVAAAKRDPAVRRIKTDLDIARSVGRSAGLSADQLSEGGVLTLLLRQERRAGRPPRTADASRQIAAATPGLGELAVAGLSTAADLATGRRSPAALMLGLIAHASLGWKALVGTGMRYDFKNDARTMQHPTSAHCPHNCRTSITLCPTAPLPSCFGTDVPGNMFYATVGRFVGFTETALQLGSQFAQLQSTRTWDPPEDTTMIALGFALPDPLDHAGLCAAVGALRGVATPHACEPCLEPTTAAIV